ncbi:MAG: hypothetical protein JO077_17370 [Verrucomicrobia bacterium]|nr:hypothetical protein [Verrucomicrobiota bacterium]
MKLRFFKKSALVVGAFPLLIGIDAMALPGPPPAPPRMPAGGLAPGGGLPPGGGFPGGGLPRGGGPPPTGGFNRPSAPGGGFCGGGGGPGPQSLSRAPNISRPGSSRPGGLAPKSNLAGGGNKQPQLPSKVQFLPKGSGSVLPSIAQGNKPAPGAKQPGPGLQGKGFPDLSGKSPGLVNGALGAGAGFSPGKMLGTGSEVKGLPDLSGKGPSELFNKAPEPLANQEFWKNWSAQNQGKVAEFQANRVGDWNNISDFRNNQNVANSFNRPEWNDYKNNVQNYWDNRAVEVNNNIQNRFDNNFSSEWWKDYRGYSGRDSGDYWSYADKYASQYDKYWDRAEKYWWWGTATYATAAAWLYAYDRSGNYGYDSGNYENRSSGSYEYGPSRSYDYGVNVASEGDNVYVDGKREASAEEYAQQAIELANTTEEQPPAPMPPEGQQAEYLPLGVWAFVQEKQGDAYMFFQISIDKNGVVSGAYKNLLGGETSPISGQVDKKTQRVAWKIGSNSSTVIEAGLKNLTEDVASCLVHFGTDTTQTWLLVRLKDPAVSNASQSGSMAKDSK